MSKTEKDLMDAFAGESQANRRYLAYSQRAEDEFLHGVAKLSGLSPRLKRFTR